jgi:hypothetical protein
VRCEETLCPERTEHSGGGGTVKGEGGMGRGGEDEDRLELFVSDDGSDLIIFTRPPDSSHDGRVQHWSNSRG